MKFGFVLSFLLFLCVGGCASQPKTEQQKYAKLQDGLKYNSYRKLSKTGLGAAIDTYNFVMEKEGKPEVTKAYVFAMSGFVWSMALQPDFAIADTNTALKRNESDKSKYISLATQSMAFYQKGWDQLGDQYGSEAKALLQGGEVGRKFDKEQQITHLVLGSLAIYNEDTLLAQNSFEQLGEAIDKPWLPDLARAVTGLKKGGVSEPIRLLRGLQNDKHLSSSERALLERMQKEISSMSEKNSSSARSLNSLFTKLAYRTLLESGDDGINKLGKSIRKFHDSVDL